MTGSKGSTQPSARRTHTPARVYPFTSLVGQEEMRLALLLNVVEPAIGGVLVTGHRGTGKSTAVRALAELLPPLTRSAHCLFNCDPDRQDELCDSCRAALAATGKLKRERTGVPVVDLPLNATEDRVCGALNLERALREGVRAYEPGLLARAHRGFLYIDEVNLLEDHLVDLLLDVAATGRNRVEREGVTASHAARFCLVGSSNPEEGELRPQLLDRFGLCAEVRTPTDATERAAVVTRREAFDRDPAAFCEAASAEQTHLRRRLVRARAVASRVEVEHQLVRAIAELCARLGVDGHRGELTIARASRALAAFQGRKVATVNDARRVAALALRHRLRRDPFEQSGGGGGQIERIADEVFGVGGESQPRARGDGTRGRSERVASATDDAGGRCEENFDKTAERDESDRSAHNPQARERDASPEGRGGASVATVRAPSSDSEMHFEEATRAKRARAPQRTPSPVRSRSPSSATGAEQRGRFYGESSGSPVSRALSFDATLRAAAERRTQTRRARSDALISTQDLRFKLFSRRAGTLYIFAVDASGSMALNRIGQAKGALARLLRRSYVRRDRVALVTFREARGEIQLRPTRSPALALRLLDELRVGGATPLASGLIRAHEIAARARREGAQRIALLVFTDGRANVTAAKLVEGEGETVDVDRAGQQLRLRLQIEREIERVGELLCRAGVESVVIDTRSRFATDDAGKRLARALGGSYTRLPLAERQ